MKRFRSKNLAVAMLFTLLFTMIVPNGLGTTFAETDDTSNGITVIEDVYNKNKEDGDIVSLHSDHKNSFSEDLKPEENCDVKFESGVMWHFVLNQTSEEDTNELELVAEFEHAGEESVGFWKSSGEGAIHFYIHTFSHDTLVDAYVELDNDYSDSPGGSGPKLVLSHVCYDKEEEPTIDEDSLNLTSMCIDEELVDTETRWRITNESGEDVEFTYEVYGTDISGSGTIPKEHTMENRFENPFYLNVDAPHPATLIIKWGNDGEFDVRKASSGDICLIELGEVTITKEVEGDAPEGVVSYEVTIHEIIGESIGELVDTLNLIPNEAQTIELESGYYLLQETESYGAEVEYSQEIFLIEEEDSIDIIITNTFEDEVVDDDDDDPVDDDDDDDDEPADDDDDDIIDDDTDDNDDTDDTTITEPNDSVPSIQGTPDPIIIEPIVPVPSTPSTPEPTIEQPIDPMPNLPFTGGVAPIELLITGLGALMVGTGIKIRKKK